MAFQRLSLCLLLLLSVSWKVVDGKFTCDAETDCVSLAGIGSFCRDDGFCSNPYEQGCLYRMLPGWTKKRVCNSDDPEDAVEQGLCRVPPIDYLEMRLFANNWESTAFEAWIVQVLLSEMLDVPASIESARYDRKISMYDPVNSFEFGGTEEYQAIEKAYELGGDCRLRKKTEDDYESCAHFVPEMWSSPTTKGLEMIDKGIMEVPKSLGVMGVESWYITRFTVYEDPTLASYIGMMGEKNRQKLAETFFRPTTWKDYCDEVSPNNCANDDGVAKRAPKNKSESERMFVDGLYIGHFRNTTKNDCDRFPTNCTGHVADYPCSWTSTVEWQTYHLNIALESDGNEGGGRGYSYQQLIDMYRAANATKSNLLLFWWNPERLFQEFTGTDAEMMRVLMPTPTQECVEARMDEERFDRCAEKLGDRIDVTKPEGVCDELPRPLEKLISSTVIENSNDPTIPEALHSPAAEVLQLFAISELQLGQLFTYFFKHKTPQEAVCRWITENMEYMEQFVPRKYPRVVEDSSEQQALMYASTFLGGLASLLVAITAMLVYRMRHKRVMVYAQIEFLWLLLAGLFMIAVGSILAGSPPSNGTCVSAIWLVNVGYSMELVPLIIKVAAINRLARAAQRLRRVVLKRRQLFGTVVVIVFLVIIILVVWTVLNTPTKMPEFDLDEPEREGDQTVITVGYFCCSGSNVWQFVAVGWNTLLLLVASVLAFQARNVRQDFNESQTLAIMIYSHFVFVLMRLATVFLMSSLSKVLVTRVQSIIFSVDTMATIIIYFVPKLVASSKEVSNHRLASHGSLFEVSSVTFGSPNQEGRRIREIAEPDLADTSDDLPVLDKLDSKEEDSSSEDDFEDPVRATEEQTVGSRVGSEAPTTCPTESLQTASHDHLPER